MFPISQANSTTNRWAAKYPNYRKQNVVSTLKPLGSPCNLNSIKIYADHHNLHVLGLFIMRLY